MDTVKRLITSTTVISYGDYLFEFINLVKVNRSVTHGSESTFIYLDTIGVYLLSGVHNLYFHFESFALNKEIIKSGYLNDKESGYKFQNLKKEINSGLSFALPKKKVINNIDCFISEIVSNNKMNNDTIKQEVLLIRNKKLNSLYKMNGLKFYNSNYNIVGFRIYDLKNKQAFVQEIETLRPLTQSEIDICVSMIKKSKLLGNNSANED